MHTHGPKCLPGPLTQERSWWSQPVPDTGKATPSSRRRKKARTMPEHQAKLPQDPEIRHELVERIRREIAAGTSVPIIGTPLSVKTALFGFVLGGRLP